MAPPIPDRWLSYKPVGKRVSGTRFIAFKVPLKEDVVKSVKDDLRLSCDSLLKLVPNLGMIIDLTNTNRYYDPVFYISNGITYEKIMIPGHDIPQQQIVKKFKRIVGNFLQQNANNTKLIGVHCTHGVNRTGYMICSFMISELKIRPHDAIRKFEAARGYRIERANYVHDLMKRSGGSQTNRVKEVVTNWHSNNVRSSHR